MTNDERDDVTEAPKEGAKGRTLYDRAVLGFPNYWYPACASDEATERPLALKLLGKPIVIVRREGKAHALADSCAHRGTQLSLGKCEFPGTPTLTCPYHGWTFDVRDGSCVAVLCEGPESKVVGRARVRTYRLEERKGIVWIWMGRLPAVELEEDVPRLLLREDTVVRVKRRILYGNWRFHAENLGGGHAQVLHRDTPGMWFQNPPAYPEDISSRVAEDVDGPQWVLQEVKGVKYKGEFPGLGVWPRPSPLRLTNWAATSQNPLFGLKHYGSALRLPGIARSLHYPFAGCMYYEWWTAHDEDHYTYFQVSCGWPKTAAERVKWELKYRLFGKPFMVEGLNNQDIEMVRQTTEFVKRRGGSISYLNRLTKQDLYHVEWRKHCNAWARGEGDAWLAQHGAPDEAESTAVSKATETRA